MFYDSGYMAGMHGMWWVFWLVVVLGVWALTRSGVCGHRSRAKETPHQVLQRRLASGDITPEQYEARKALLDRDAPGNG
jgi:putative membrane protein